MWLLIGLNLKKTLTAIFSRINWKSKEIPVLHIYKIATYQEYRTSVTANQNRDAEIFFLEQNLVPSPHAEFNVKGFCYVCKKVVGFMVDFKYSYEVNSILTPNWRERLVCPHCGLNNRKRAAIQVFEQECKPKHDSTIYITEQITPLYSYLNEHFTNIIGSEYISTSVDYGGCNENGIRNENLTKLSFKSNEFDYILSFDVFEHIPDYRKAFSECLRCLKPYGKLFFSVPFDCNSKNNLVRARVTPDGSIEHILPAEYHGDPLRSDGLLSYYRFGWKLLEELRELGFSNVMALIYWSRKLCYLGQEQVIFTAEK